MSLSLVVLIGVLFTTGTYLILQRSLMRIVLGVGLLANGANIAILAGGARRGSEPIIGADGVFTDPLPQALILTAVVIGFALTAYLIALAWRLWNIQGTDEVEDDPEDARLARAAGAFEDHQGDVPSREDREP